MNEKNYARLMTLALLNIPCTCLVVFGAIIATLPGFNIRTIIAIGCGLVSIGVAIRFSYVVWDYSNKQYIAKRELDNISNEDMQKYAGEKYND